MEETHIQNPTSDNFFDTLDQFSSSDEEDLDSSHQSRLKSLENEVSEVISVKNSPENPFYPSFSGKFRRRSSRRFSKSGSSSFSSSGSNFTSNLNDSSAVAENSPRNRLLQFREDHKRVSERFDSSLNENEEIDHKFVRSSRRKHQDHEISRSSSLNKEGIEEIAVNDSLTSILESEEVGTSEKQVEINERVINASVNGDLYESSSNFLVLIAGLVIKAIGFQVVLLISFVTFPIWLVLQIYKFLTEPVHTLNRAKERCIQILLRIYGFTPERLRGLSIGKLVKGFCWGCFWSVYICIMLVMLLGFAVFVSWIVMRKIVEEPIRMMKVLNFDYTMENPVAFVPAKACEGFYCGHDCREKYGVPRSAGNRLIPLNHKLKLTVSLTLPESDYNRKLGVFQVKVEFLSANAEVTAGSSHPCILRFKSPPLYYAETLLRGAPLLSGYSSESQILNLRMSGFTEGAQPTACIRVILEHRAEYKTGSGIPEIYAATLLLESELPLVKRILWSWKTTVFIWAIMGFFIMELLLTLVCCRAVIFPSARPVNGSLNRR